MISAVACEETQSIGIHRLLRVYFLFFSKSIDSILRAVAVELVVRVVYEKSTIEQKRHCKKLLTFKRAAHCTNAFGNWNNPTQQIILLRYVPIRTLSPPILFIREIHSGMYSA